MVQAIFYAMAVSDVAEPSLMSRLLSVCMMWVMQQLDWAAIEFWLENIDRRLRRAQVARALNPPIDPVRWDVPKGLAGLQVADRHLQFPSLLAFIDGWVVTGVPLKNQCREPKRIPYAVPLFEPDTPAWSSFEYSSTPSILSPEVEVSYLWEITIVGFMNDF
ncbi:hypothetical protein Cgig2_033556 [Carnegiea gigantea]|uniref:Uncharacterized protein n=1 Tax=Carnegiea gigantea TaxID=171969 RepID=A0A9Q1JTT3_9CARY|nr:hypothetical protein Cgig2_033556 [Carnegiea gigantea]